MGRERRAPRLVREPRGSRRESPFGFDTTDHLLDIWVDPDRSWRWKDEDHLAEAIEIGLFTTEQAEAMRTEGERMVQRIEAWAAPFDEGWENWLAGPPLAAALDSGWLGEPEELGPGEPLHGAIDRRDHLVRGARRVVVPALEARRAGHVADRLGGITQSPRVETVRHEVHVQGVRAAQLPEQVSGLGRTLSLALLPAFGQADQFNRAGICPCVAAQRLFWRRCPQCAHALRRRSHPFGLRKPMERRSVPLASSWER